MNIRYTMAHILDLFESRSLKYVLLESKSWCQVIVKCCCWTILKIKTKISAKIWYDEIIFFLPVGNRMPQWVPLKGQYRGSVKLFIEFLELTARLVRCSQSSSKSPHVWSIILATLLVLRIIYQSCSPRSPPSAASSADPLAKNVHKSKGCRR